MTWDGTVKTPGTIDEVIKFLKDCKKYYGLQGTDKVEIILVEGPVNFSRDENRRPRNDINWSKVERVNIVNAFPERILGKVLQIGIPFQIEWKTEKHS